MHFHFLNLHFMPYVLIKNDTIENMNFQDAEGRHQFIRVNDHVNDIQQMLQKGSFIGIYFCLLLYDSNSTTIELFKY